MTSRLAAVRLNKVIAKAMAGMLPPDDLTVTEWAEQNRRLCRERRRARTVAHRAHPLSPRADECMDRPKDTAHRHGGRVPGRQV